MLNTANAQQFQVGQVVKVLNASRLPKVEEVRHIGAIVRVDLDAAQPLYWIDGLPMARTANVLRAER